MNLSLTRWIISRLRTQQVIHNNSYTHNGAFKKDSKSNRVTKVLEMIQFFSLLYLNVTKIDCDRKWKDIKTTKWISSSHMNLNVPCLLQQRVGYSLQFNSFFFTYIHTLCIYRSYSSDFWMSNRNFYAWCNFATYRRTFVIQWHFNTDY